MIHRSVTGEVRKQDQVKVEDFLVGSSKISMNPDGTCDVIGDVRVSSIGLKSLKQLTPRIRKITDCFLCYNNELTDLDGAPEKVGGSFDCSENQLTSLEGCPDTVIGDFYCDDDFTKSDVKKYCNVGGEIILN